MSKNYEIEWIPTLLDQLSSVQGLPQELLSDIMLAQACMHANLSLKPKKKIKKKKHRKKKKKIPKTAPFTVSVEIKGKLPHNLSERAFKHAVTPIFEDHFNGHVVYHGFSKMNNGTYCYNFSGPCPIHLREHKGGARIWQLKQHKKSDWSGFKCWKGDSYKKCFSIEILTGF